jgi:hypothetical protein
MYVVIAQNLAAHNDTGVTSQAFKDTAVHIVYRLHYVGDTAASSSSLVHRICF